MNAKMVLLVLSVAAAIPGHAIACGACVEDRVAATYDHSVVQSAIARHRTIVFVALDGPDASLVGDRIRSAAAALEAVQRESLRYAASPAAFSFMLARDATPDRVVDAFRKALGGKHVTMTIVRVMRDGRLSEPPAASARAETKGVVAAAR